jgi:hypothetical protein
VCMEENPSRLSYGNPKGQHPSCRCVNGVIKRARGLRVTLQQEGFSLDFGCCYIRVEKKREAWVCLVGAMRLLVSC